MITVCCVMVSDYCGRGSEYVNILGRTVKKHLTVPHQFICFTDNPRGIEFETKPISGDGWFAKLYLFKEFNEGLVIFFDLDTLILGNIDFMARFKGEFACLRDFYREKGYGSGVMMWKGGFGHSITDDYEKDGQPMVEGGDQIYLEQKIPKAKRLQDMYPDKFVSYKAHSMTGKPKKASVVCFHGYPKPSDFTYGWVHEAWK